MPTLTGSDTKPTDSLIVPTVDGNDGTWGTVLNDTTFQTIADYFAWLEANLPTGAIVGATDTQTLTDKTLGDDTIFRNGKYAVGNVGLTGSNESLAFEAVGGYLAYSSTISADTQLTIGSAPTSGLAIMDWELTQDGTGGREVTFVGVDEWVNGAPDTADMDANEVAFFQFRVKDNGTVYGWSSIPARINYQTGTSYTVQPSDDGKTVRCANASAIAFNVDTEANMGAIPNGFVVAIRQWAAGTVTVTALSGVNINSPGGATDLDGQYASAALEYQGSDVWALDGRLA